jgi:hypothetical protein
MEGKGHARLHGRNIGVIPELSRQVQADRPSSRREKPQTGMGWLAQDATGVPRERMANS